MWQAINEAVRNEVQNAIHAYLFCWSRVGRTELAADLSVERSRIHSSIEADLDTIAGGVADYRAALAALLEWLVARSLKADRLDGAYCVLFGDLNLGFDETEVLREAIDARIKTLIATRVPSPTYYRAAGTSAHGLAGVLRSRRAGGRPTPPA